MSNPSNCGRLLIIFVIFVAFAPARGPWAVFGQAQSTQPAPPAQAQQRPVFRGGTRFVRVDAYPVENGKIVEGLKPQDFEILEDGKSQAIDSFDFIKFDTFRPEAERREPQSQRESFDMAADPRNRVFVIFVDMVAAGKTDVYQIERPLVNFLDRIVSPNDLFALMTSRNTAKDLVLGRRTTVVESQVMDLFRSMNVDRDDADDLFFGCMLPDPTIEQLKVLHRIDASYTALESTVAQLGAIRQERKSIILVTNTMSRARPATGFLEQTAALMPKAGITQGRVGIGNQKTATGATNDIVCTSEVQRLAAIDFDQRYRDLLDEARRENVAFYPVTPAGLQTTGSRANDDLKSLADGTDGVAIIDTNDLTGGLKRIADDLAAYYVLGYYTTNTKFDGGIRKITVKLRGKTIRARRQYRAPTEAEIAELTNRSSAAPAFGAAAASGSPAVIGEPAAFRVSRTQPPERVKLPEFVHSDRIRIEWPVLAALDRREARMLDTAGKPLPFDLPLSEAPDGKYVVVELPLAPFGRGSYSIELIAASGGRTEQRGLTFIVK